MHPSRVQIGVPSRDRRPESSTRATRSRAPETAPWCAGRAEAGPRSQARKADRRGARPPPAPRPAAPPPAGIPTTRAAPPPAAAGAARGRAAAGRTRGRDVRPRRLVAQHVQPRLEVLNRDGAVLAALPVPEQVDHALALPHEQHAQAGRPLILQHRLAGRARHLDRAGTLPLVARHYLILRDGRRSPGRLLIGDGAVPVDVERGEKLIQLGAAGLLVQPQLPQPTTKLGTGDTTVWREGRGLMWKPRARRDAGGGGRSAPGEHRAACPALGRVSASPRCVCCGALTLVVIPRAEEIDDSRVVLDEQRSQAVGQRGDVLGREALGATQRATQRRPSTARRGRH
eukprot:scaffold11655_cov121-Isochrysis_galbana.AAC.4